MPLDPLHPGDELHCPHCGAWHVLIQPYVDHSTAARDMLFFECRGHRYFAGQIGEPSARYPTRNRRS